MKKLLLLFLSILLFIGLIACQSQDVDSDPTENPDGEQETQNENLEGSLEDILQKIYETAEVDDQFREYIKEGLQTQEITDENIVYHLGKEGIEFEEAIASEPIMMPSAYSLCLVRVKDGADVEKIKSEIKENVNPQKWVCVGVDPNNVIVDNIGDVIILIMSDDQGKALHDAFLALKK